MGLFDANNVKCAEIRKLVEEQQYKKALKVLEKVNINKIKSIADLNIFAYVYQKNKMYEEARDVLYRIYEKRQNKRVIYKLVYLAILVSDFEEAEALYEEYVDIAQGTAEQYILRYGLDKAERKDYKIRIESLLKIKELDYSEEWAYELAKTYHKAGMTKECVAECENIILWFGKGKIVEKATLLRAYYMDGVEVLQSYGIVLNEKGEYYYNEEVAQAYYKANHPKTSAGDNTQNLSAQISYITEQKRQRAIHNELTKDLEPTIDIHQMIMQETEGSPAFMEELQQILGSNAEMEELRYQNNSPQKRESIETQRIQQMKENKPKNKVKQPDNTEKTSNIISIEDILRETNHNLEDTIKLTKSKKADEKQKNNHISQSSQNQIIKEKEDDKWVEEIEEEEDKSKKVKRVAKFSLFSRKNKEKQKDDESSPIQMPKDEANLMIEQAKREELIKEAQKREAEKKKIKKAVEMEEEFSDNISNTKNLFERLRGKTSQIKKENAAIEKEQNILTSLTEKSLAKEEWNISIEVPQEAEPPEEIIQEKKKKSLKVKPLTKEEWLQKTKRVSQQVEASQKGELEREELKQDGPKKVESVIGDTISIKIKPKDTKIVIDGIDLTEIFGGYAKQPRVRAQLLKELTRMREGERPIHIALSEKDDEQTMEFIRSLGKAIKTMEILDSHRIASIDAEKLNKIQLSDKQDELKGGCVAVRNAGKITADTAQSILNMIEKYNEEVVVILVDQNSSLDFLMAEYPVLAKYFKYNITI